MVEVIEYERPLEKRRQRRGRVAFMCLCAEYWKIADSLAVYYAAPSKNSKLKLFPIYLAILNGLNMVFEWCLSACLCVYICVCVFMQ